MKKLFQRRKMKYEEEFSYDWNEMGYDVGDEMADDIVYDNLEEEYSAEEEYSIEEGYSEEEGNISAEVPLNDMGYYFAEDEAEGEYTDAEELRDDMDYYIADEMEEENDYADGSFADEEIYYADGGFADEEKYYADGGFEGEEKYYADGGFEGEENDYTGGGFEGEEKYYADGGFEGEENDYADGGFEEEKNYYADNDSGEEEYYSPGRGIAANRDNRSGSFFNKIWKGFLAMEKMDRVITVAGGAVLVLAIITGGIYAGAKAMDKQISGFADVGRQLDGINLIGEEGLLAVANAQIARAAVSNVVEAIYEPEQTRYEEEEYSKDVTITLNMSSIQKDLKIKFLNKDTNKLISNIPFSVTITDPDGKKSVWTDDDKDGIIYKKDISPGKYAVLVNSLEDEKYAAYLFPASEMSVEVKKDIAYEKVDVSDEIKSESEINASKEDTKVNDTKVESTLSDTLAWVESTVIPVTYIEVLKSTIPDPGAQTIPYEPLPLSYTGGISESSRTLKVGESFQLTASGGDNFLINIIWSSSNPSVASIDQSGKVTGAANGTALITYTANISTVSGNEVIASEIVTGGCSVRVVPDYTQDVTTPLKDVNGIELYVQENGGYRAAVNADYYKLDKFFIKGDAKYTGWQTLDGKVYFFDKDGNKAIGEQVIQGAKYNFASDGSLVVGSGTMGIDVSKWNGSIDWNAVKNSGISYVIIRCGYRGSSEGSLVVDPKYHANIKGAAAAGLKVGVYFFTQAIDEREAVEEASMVLELVKSYKISYPIFLDVESSGGRADSISKETRTAVCKAFCQTIKAAGYTAGIYANKNWLTTKIDAGQLSAYKIWLAQYASAPSYTGRYDLWQYKSTGRVSGISGNVDMNISYLGY